VQAAPKGNRRIESSIPLAAPPAERGVVSWFASVRKSGLKRSAVSQSVEACQLLAVMRRIQRRKYAELADVIKRVVADSTLPEVLQALPVIEACDAFLAALAADVLDDVISNGFLAAIDQLMQSGTAISQHPEVLQAAQAARALNDFSDLDELYALRDALAGELDRIYTCAEENGFFPDMCLVSRLEPRDTGCMTCKDYVSSAAH
jgi:hypothetical protein